MLESHASSSNRLHLLTLCQQAYCFSKAFCRSWRVTEDGLMLATTPEPQCTLMELHGCLQSLQTQSNDLAFAATRYELLTLCSTLKESVSCVDDHMKLCFTPTQRKVFNHVVAGARQVLLELCVPGPIQEAYLKHAPCFKNVSLAEDKCAPKYRYLMELSENVNQRQNVDEGLRESCCAFGEFVTCKYLYVSQDCGSRRCSLSTTALGPHI
ncbi:uncharacterized protein TNIN_3681 [Trichonephila inaurata madagascariensis]|uniref:DUF19 domain-containing protein n=1 Tax=Trichonephila inaurata madagascariensis TaxID=2747483 RepID=A0A8X7CFZ2_9ARAC|nr:uncharacterized protein TNIN_3681 [Trichonephila inaurata madagascariensis]